MILPGLPIGSLNRDEFYAFLGGLFISLSWLQYWTSEWKNINEPLVIGLFLTLWLFSVALLFLLQLFIFNVIAPQIDNRIKNVPAAEQRLYLEVIRGRINYYSDAFKETMFHCALISVVLIATIMSVFPLAHLVDLYFKSKFYVYVFCVICLGIILSGSVAFYKLRIKYSAFLYLYKIGAAIIIDRKTYDEELAKDAARQYLSSFHKKKE